MDAIVSGSHKKEEKLSRGNYVKAIYVGLLSRGNFTGDSCLRVIISGHLFHRAMVWVPIVRS